MSICHEPYFTHHSRQNIGKVAILDRSIKSSTSFTFAEAATMDGKKLGSANRPIPTGDWFPFGVPLPPKTGVTNPVCSILLANKDDVCS